MVVEELVWMCRASHSIRGMTKRKWGGVVVSLRASERKVWSSKLYENTTGIRQEGHPEFEVLRYSSTKSGSQAKV